MRPSNARPLKRKFRWHDGPYSVDVSSLFNELHQPLKARAGNCVARGVVQMGRVEAINTSDLPDCWFERFFAERP